MKNSILALLTAFILTSCSSFRELTENDKSKGEIITESGTKTRAGDTTKQDLPVKYRYQYKDTTIVTTNYETKQVIRTVFDKEGNQSIECISDEINERFDRIEERFENDISKDLKSEKSFTPQDLFYGVAAIIITIAVLGIVMLIVLVKMQKAAPKLMAQAVAEVLKSTN